MKLEPTKRQGNRATKSRHARQEPKHWVQAGASKFGPLTQQTHGIRVSHPACVVVQSCLFSTPYSFPPTSTTPRHESSNRPE